MERKRARKRNRSLTSNDALLPFSQKTSCLCLLAHSILFIFFLPSCTPSAKLDLLGVFVWDSQWDKT